jgi:hypothetical protein
MGERMFKIEAGCKKVKRREGRFVSDRGDGVVTVAGSKSFKDGGAASGSYRFKDGGVEFTFFTSGRQEKEHLYLSLSFQLQYYLIDININILLIYPR